MVEWRLTFYKINKKFVSQVEREREREGEGEGGRYREGEYQNL